MKKKRILYTSAVSLGLFCSLFYLKEGYKTDAAEIIQTTELSEPTEEPVYSITEAQLDTAIQEFLQQKNSCYMDGTDMTVKTYTDTYQMYVERIRPLFYEINYSTDFFLHRLAYSHEINQLRKSIISDYQYQILEIKNRKIQGNIASATVKEQVTYQDSTRKEKTGFNLYYTITYLASEDGLKIWKIENEEPFYGDYYKEDGSAPKEVFDSILEELYQDADYISTECNPVFSEIPPLSYQNTVLYDGNLAASYARRYALNYNPAFPSYQGSGGDCASYGSQTVFFGLGGTTPKTFPMLIEGADNSRLWYQGSILGSTAKNWNWTSTSRFFNYVTSGGSNIPGLYGRQIPLEEVKPGDIVQVDYSNNGSINHTIIITGIDNPNGTNSRLQITYSAHTGDRMEHPLSEFGYKASFRAIRIYGMVSPLQLSNYWGKNEKGWYYVSNGAFTVNSWKKIGSDWYYFDENGIMKKGWFFNNQDWYYLQEDGRLLTSSSIIEDNTMYSFDNEGRWIEEE